MAIQLTKGQRIALTKENNAKLINFCIGANWGAIKTKGLFGGDKVKAVDLDLSVALLNANKDVRTIVYFGELQTDGIQHSGDDLVGDTEADDNDNEVISINLDQVDEDIHYITIVLNSYNKIDFGDIPFASIRIFEGTPNKVQTVFAKFKIDNNEEFAGSKGMILGALYKHNDEWKFNSIGQPVPDHELRSVIAQSTQVI